MSEITKKLALDKLPGDVESERVRFLEAAFEHFLVCLKRAPQGSRATLAAAAAVCRLWMRNRSHQRLTADLERAINEDSLPTLAFVPLTQQLISRLGKKGDDDGADETSTTSGHVAPPDYPSTTQVVECLHRTFGIDQPDPWPDTWDSNRPKRMPHTLSAYPISSHPPHHTKPNQSKPNPNKPKPDRLNQTQRNPTQPYTTPLQSHPTILNNPILLRLSAPSHPRLTPTCWGSTHRLRARSQLCYAC